MISDNSKHHDGRVKPGKQNIAIGFANFFTLFRKIKMDCGLAFQGCLIEIRGDWLATDCPSF